MAKLPEAVHNAKKRQVPSTLIISIAVDDNVTYISDGSEGSSSSWELDDTGTKPRPRFRCVCSMADVNGVQIGRPTTAGRSKT